MYHETENGEFIRPRIHKTCILPKVGNMTLLPNPGKPGFYGVGLRGRVISCQPCVILESLVCLSAGLVSHGHKSLYLE